MCVCDSLLTILNCLHFKCKDNVKTCTLCWWALLNTIQLFFFLSFYHRKLNVLWSDNQRCRRKVTDAMIVENYSGSQTHQQRRYCLHRKMFIYLTAHNKVMSSVEWCDFNTNIHRNIEIKMEGKNNKVVINSWLFLCRAFFWCSIFLQMKATSAFSLFEYKSKYFNFLI